MNLNQQIEMLTAALEKIANLDPQVDSNDTNEWAESECFYKAQDIARNALNTSVDETPSPGL